MPWKKESGKDSEYHESGMIGGGVRGYFCGMTTNLPDGPVVTADDAAEMREYVTNWMSGWVLTGEYQSMQPEEMQKQILLFDWIHRCITAAVKK